MPICRRPMSWWDASGRRASRLLSLDLLSLPTPPVAARQGVPHPVQPVQLVPRGAQEAAGDAGRLTRRAHALDHPHPTRPLPPPPRAPAAPPPALLRSPPLTHRVTSAAALAVSASRARRAVRREGCRMIVFLPVWT